MIANNNRLFPYILSVTLIFYGFFFVDNLPLSGPPDELAHASYIADAENSNFLIPNYKSGKIIGSEQLNFLSHPPLYYSIQAIFGNVLRISAEYDYKEFRVLSLIMVSIGFLFLLKAAKSLGVSDGFLLIITLGAMSVPNFIYIASSINNDNLVFLGVALMFFSMVKFYSTTASTRSWAIAGLYVSLLIIALGKVNAALFAIVFLISWLFFSRGKFFFEFFKNKRWIGLMLLSFILFGYFVYTYFLYGTFFPAPKYVYELKSPDNPISFLTYIKQFFVLFVTRFSGAYGHTSYLVYPGIFVYGLYFILFSPILVYASVRFFVESVFIGNPVYRLFDAVFVGAAVLLATHLYKGYEGYLATEIVGAVQPRYYLFLIPLIWLPIFVLAGHRKLISLYVILFSSIVLFLAPISVSYSASSLMQAKLPRQSGVYKDGPSVPINEFKAGLPLTSFKLGHMDLMRVDEERVLFLGWAYDHDKGITPNSILIFRNNVLVARFGLNMVRPDVAIAFNSLNANNAGFRISLPIDGLVNLCDYVLLAEFEGGLHSVLFEDKC